MASLVVASESNYFRSTIDDLLRGLSRQLTRRGGGGGAQQHAGGGSIIRGDGGLLSLPVTSVMRQEYEGTIGFTLASVDVATPHPYSSGYAGALLPTAAEFKDNKQLEHEILQALLARGSHRRKEDNHVDSTTISSAGLTSSSSSASSSKKEKDITEALEAFDAAAAYKYAQRISKAFRNYSCEVDKEMAQHGTATKTKTTVKPPITNTLQQQQSKEVCAAASRFLDSVALVTRKRILFADIVALLSAASVNEKKTTEHQKIRQQFIQTAEGDDAFYNINNNNNKTTTSTSTSSVSSGTSSSSLLHHLIGDEVNDIVDVPYVSTPAVLHSYLKSILIQTDAKTGANTKTQPHIQALSAAAACLANVEAYFGLVTQAVVRTMFIRCGFGGSSDHDQQSSQVMIDSIVSSADKALVSLKNLADTVGPALNTIAAFLTAYNITFTGMLSQELANVVDPTKSSSSSSMSVASSSSLSAAASADPNSTVIPTGPDAQSKHTDPAAAESVSSPQAAAATILTSAFSPPSSPPQSAQSTQVYAEGAGAAAIATSNNSNSSGPGGAGAPEPMSPKHDEYIEAPPPDTTDEEKILWRRLIHFYQYYGATDKLANVGTIVQQSHGHEHQLFDALVEKYGPEPTTSQVAAMLLARSQARQTEVSVTGNTAAATATVPSSSSSVPALESAAAATVNCSSTAPLQTHTNNLTTTANSESESGKTTNGQQLSRQQLPQHNSPPPQEAPQGANTIRKLCAEYGVSEETFRDLNKEVLPLDYNSDQPIPIGTKLLVPLPEEEHDEQGADAEEKKKRPAAAAAAGSSDAASEQQLEQKSAADQGSSPSSPGAASGDEVEGEGKKCVIQ